MASRRPRRRARSNTAACWAALPKPPEGWTQAPSQAALGVRASSPWTPPDGGKARADTVRAPTRPASRSRAVTTREGGRGTDRRLWRGAWRKLLLLGDSAHHGREMEPGLGGGPPSGGDGRLPGI